MSFAGRWIRHEYRLHELFADCPPELCACERCTPGVPRRESLSLKVTAVDHERRTVRVTTEASR